MAPLRDLVAAPPDLAYNPGDRAFPRISISFTSRFHSVTGVTDMRIAFTRYSRNRWTAFGSPIASDWLELDFDAPRTAQSVELSL